MKADWIPSAPDLSDKLADWQFLADFGGEFFVRGKDVLDVGPFFGVDALMFAGKAKRYVVLDSVCGVLAHLAKVAPNAERVDANAEEPWPLSAGSFDTVLDFSTFDDLTDPLHGYREAHRVLRPGGTLFSAFGNALVLKKAIPHQTYQVPDELRVYLIGLGFRGVRVTRTDQARAMVVGAKA